MVECSLDEEKRRDEDMARLLQRYHYYEERDPYMGQYSGPADSIDHLFCYHAQPKVRIYFSKEEYDAGKLMSTVANDVGDIVDGKHFWEQTWRTVYRDEDGPYVFIVRYPGDEGEL